MGGCQILTETEMCSLSKSPESFFNSLMLTQSFAILPTPSYPASLLDLSEIIRWKVEEGKGTASRRSECHNFFLLNGVSRESIAAAEPQHLEHHQ
jgi:hypothetical protein